LDWLGQLAVSLKKTEEAISGLLPCPEVARVVKSQVKPELVVPRSKRQDIAGFLKYFGFKPKGFESSGNVWAVEACTNYCKLHR
jgi:hypothetical protein